MTSDSPDRRDLLQAVAALTLGTAQAQAAPSAATATAPAPAASAPAQPSLPFEPTMAPRAGPGMLRPPVGQRTPGKPGDFDFLNGHWRIRHQRLRPGQGWDGFEGEASCFSILGGLISVEELRIPARRFSGMGLRLLDVKQRLWSDHWVSAAFGVLGSAGQPGSFEDGIGIFDSEDDEDGRKVIYRGVWDRIGPRACRWQQGASRDRGRTWELSWSMDWERMG